MLTESVKRFDPPETWSYFDLSFEAILNYFDLSVMNLTCYFDQLDGLKNIFEGLPDFLNQVRSVLIFLHIKLFKK